MGDKLPPLLAILDARDAGANDNGFAGDGPNAGDFFFMIEEVGDATSDAFDVVHPAGGGAGDDDDDAEGGTNAGGFCTAGCGAGAGAVGDCAGGNFDTNFLGAGGGGTDMCDFFLAAGATRKHVLQLNHGVIAIVENTPRTTQTSSFFFVSARKDFSRKKSNEKSNRASSHQHHPQPPSKRRMVPLGLGVGSTATRRRAATARASTWTH